MRRKWERRRRTMRYRREVVRKGSRGEEVGGQEGKEDEEVKGRNIVYEG